MKKAAAIFLPILISMILYWLAGFDFVRCPELAAFFMGGVFFSLGFYGAMECGV